MMFASIGLIIFGLLGSFIYSAVEDSHDGYYQD